ncbi:MAG: hypothetical protein Q8L88_01575 [Bacteroidota bacterium]|nr:hypothetical protein [Bacteroidota bacterium]
MKNIYTFGFLSITSLALLNGCGTSAPESFMRMTKQYWEVVDVKQSIKYDDAWQRVIYIVTKKFELEMISKEDGYVRSAFGPSYFSEDMINDKYQVRIVAKFTPDRKKVEYKIESRIWTGKIWENGSDVRVAANMRKDFVNSLVEPVKKSPAGTAAPTDSLQQQQQIQQ